MHFNLKVFLKISITLIKIQILWLNIWRLILSVKYIMSQITRSKGRAVRLNTLVSSSKQGNNSIASAMDSEDSNQDSEDPGILSSHIIKKKAILEQKF